MYIYWYLAVIRVVESSSEVTRREHLPFPDGRRVFHMLPLAFVEKKELMGPRAILQSEHVGGAGPVNSHGSGGLICTSDAGELVTGPDTEYGSYGEVGVHNA